VPLGALLGDTGSTGSATSLPPAQAVRPDRATALARPSSPAERMAAAGYPQRLWVATVPGYHPGDAGVGQLGGHLPPQGFMITALPAEAVPGGTDVVARRNGQAPGIPVDLLQPALDGPPR
jgi:hypothetical protein